MSSEPLKPAVTLLAARNADVRASKSAGRAQMTFVDTNGIPFAVVIAAEEVGPLIVRLSTALAEQFQDLPAPPGNRFLPLREIQFLVSPDGKLALRLDLGGWSFSAEIPTNAAHGLADSLEHWRAGANPRPMGPAGHS